MFSLLLFPLLVEIEFRDRPACLLVIAADERALGSITFRVCVVQRPSQTSWTDSIRFCFVFWLFSSSLRHDGVCSIERREAGSWTLLIRALISSLHLTDWRLVETSYFSYFFTFSGDGRNARVGKDIKKGIYDSTAKKNWNATKKRTHCKHKIKRKITKQDTRYYYISFYFFSLFCLLSLSPGRLIIETNMYIYKSKALFSFSRRPYVYTTHITCEKKTKKDARYILDTHSRGERERGAAAAAKVAETQWALRIPGALSNHENAIRQRPVVSLSL